MNILVINGSPKGEKSNTLKITNAFIDGINNVGNHFIEIIIVSQKSIEPCRGCFCCWEKTPGRCVIVDDMSGILEKYIKVDLVIWSFPLYYFGIPSKTKALMDRLLPNNLPNIVSTVEGSARHPQRHNLQNQRHILISTCGFFTTQNNYEALVTQFEILFGNHLTKILCPEGELFRIPQLENRTGEYLSYVIQAGKEYIQQGFFSDGTREKLNEPLYPPETFMEMANASWEYEATEGETGGTDKTGLFLRQMAAVYRPHGQDKEITLEFNFTDIGKTYQLVLGKTTCVVKTDDFLPYTTRIETPFEVWLAISEGKINGQDALFQHKYQVSGDFSMMLALNSYFSSTKPEPSGEVKTKKRTMWLFILPWMVFWPALSTFPDVGAYLALIIAAAMPLFSYVYAFTFYDALSAFSVIALSAAYIYGLPLMIILAASYAVFASLWLVSALFTRTPLSALYMSSGYGGDAAFDNPLFMLTNKIIDIAWGILYLVCCVVMAGGFFIPAILLNTIGSLAMGVFTAFFVKWYPAHYARKR